MEQSRRQPMQEARGERLHAVEPDACRHPADVTVLGDYKSRVNETYREAARGRATQFGTDPTPIGQGTRGLREHARQNQLLAALPAADFERLRPALEPVALPVGFVIAEAGSHADHVYFPVSGVVSLAQELASGATAEVAAAGNDGLVGVALLLGGERTASRAVVRAAGHAYRVRAAVLGREFDHCRALRQVVLRYTQALLTEVAQTAVCRGHHSVEQQLCRLLLSTLDRLPGNELALTHDTIAELLGVRRESISATAGKLQAAGLIHYHRGRIGVLDRQELLHRVCECYAVVKAESCRRFVPQYTDPCAPMVMARRVAGGVALPATA